MTKEQLLNLHDFRQARADAVILCRNKKPTQAVLSKDNEQEYILFI